jgi:hypothetical protein
VVLIAASLVDQRYGVAIKLLAIPTFIVAAIVTRFFIIRRERRTLDATAHVCWPRRSCSPPSWRWRSLGAVRRPGQSRAIATGLLAATRWASRIRRRAPS